MPVNFARVPQRRAIVNFVAQANGLLCYEIRVNHPSVKQLAQAAIFDLN